MISIKPGVKLQCPKLSASGRTISSVWGVALPVIASVYESGGYECVITSAFDGVHKQDSLHYIGRALDFRTRHLTDPLAFNIATAIRRALGPDFDVVLEEDHIHIEYDPKG